MMRRLRLLRMFFWFRYYRLLYWLNDRGLWTGYDRWVNPEDYE